TFAAQLKDVDYLDRPDTARVVLALDGPADAKLVSSGDRQAVLELSGVDIPPRLERTLDTREYDGPVRAVASYRDPREPSKVRMVVDAAEAAAPRVQRAGTTVYVDFAKPAVAAAAPKAQVYAPPVVGGYGVATTPVTSQTVAQRAGAQPKTATVRGGRIEMD